MDDPAHALAASRHPDPYPWYARLRVSRPIFFDAGIGLWVVSGPYLVRQALQDARLRVRPPAEPVPVALLGRPTGAVFAQLVRMNDGEFHAVHRPALAALARGFDEAAVAAAAEAAVRDLLPRTGCGALLSALPVQAVARLLRVPAQDLDATVRHVHAFTRGIAPGADAQALDEADAATEALLAQGRSRGASPVAAVFRIALMQQSLDATSALLGNAIHWLQCHAASASVHEVLAQVLRSDPPLHNTRRFAAEPVELGGQAIAAEDGLLLVLVGPQDDGHLQFGGGAHACPGENLALQLAGSALRTLRSLEGLARFGAVRGYRPLANARIPVFSGPAAPAA